jgi:hypothetical protein
MEPKNTQETLAALSATNPAAVVSLMFEAIRMTWRAAGAAKKWLKDAFTDRIPAWRFSSWNVKGNLKTGDFSMNHLSESSNYPAAIPKHSKKARKRRARG